MMTAKSDGAGPWFTLSLFTRPRSLLTRSGRKVFIGCWRMGASAAWGIRLRPLDSYRSKVAAIPCAMYRSR